MITNHHNPSQLKSPFPLEIQTCIPIHLALVFEALPVLVTVGVHLALVSEVVLVQEEVHLVLVSEVHLALVVALVQEEVLDLVEDTLQ